MCVAAYLSVFGLGGGLAASVFPLLRPVTAACVALSIVALVLQWRRTQRRPRPRAACCER